MNIRRDKKMSLYGVTKGTEVESIIDNNIKGEANGVVMYYALSYLAREEGLNDIAETLEKIAQDEARHAAFYSILNGQVNKDIFAVFSNIQKAESAALPRLNEFAENIRKMGLEEVAEKIKGIALDEERHGRILQEIIDKK
jgi:rubrerythrin